MGKKHKNFVVFLDVDGVLNTRTTVQQTPKGYQGIDDARVEVLAKTISKFGGADIVLSSDWKELEPTDEDYRYLVSKLARYGLVISGQDVQKRCRNCSIPGRTSRDQRICDSG